VNPTCSVRLVADIFGIEPDGIDPNVSVILDVPLSTLNERERQVLTLVYGLEDGQPRTLQYVGQELSPPVTREWVRRIKVKGLQKLRHPTRQRLIRSYVASDAEPPKFRA
jgi:hypothetical protein